MRLQDFLLLLRKHWILVALCTAVVAGLAAVVTFRATPIYTSKASVFVSLPSGNTPGELSQGSTYTQGLMQSFGDLATRPVVLNEVIQELDLDTTTTALARKVRARVIGDTVIMEIWASDASPAKAAAIANSVVKHLNESAREVSPKRDDGKPTVEMSALGEALPPLYPSAPNKRRNVAAALLAGFLLGIAAAVGREKLDTRFPSTADVSSRTAVPVLAELADDAAMKPGVVVMRDKPLAPTSEEFRRLRTNLEFLRVGGKSIALVVTSADPAEGKSSVSLNLAVACAQGGDRVLLIDADMRKPSLAGRLGLDDARGLSTVLAGRATLADAVVAGGRGLGIDVLPSGPIPPNPADLLNSPAMNDLLAEVLLRYDVVLLDTPPVLPVVDAAVLSRQASGALLVVRVNRTRRESMAKALDSLGQVGAKVLGIVVNAVPRASGSQYYNYVSTTAPRQRPAQKHKVPPSPAT